MKKWDFGKKNGDNVKKIYAKRLKMVKITKFGGKYTVLDIEKNRDTVKKNRDSRKFSIKNRDCPS